MAAFVIAQHEILKLFGTRRGWVSIVAFLLVWAVILMFVVQPAVRFLANPDTGGLIGMLFDNDRTQFINHWSTREVSLYWFVSLYVLPFFAVLIAADQIAGDRTRGTLRYLLLRANRFTLYFARFLGQLFIMLLLVISTFLATALLTAYHAPERAQLMLTDTAPIVFNVWLVLMPYVALMALLSVLARSARQAIIYSVIAWITVSLLLWYIQRNTGDMPWLDWIMPGAQVRALLRLDGWDTLQLAAVPLAHTAVLLLVGACVMWRRDL